MIKRSNGKNLQIEFQTNFRKEDNMKILFSDEKFFDTDGIYKSQNDRRCAVSSVDADKKGGIWERKVSAESNDLVERLSQGRNAVGDFR